MMNHPYVEKIFQAAKETWGSDRQRLKLIEECSELSQAMAKLLSCEKHETPPAVRSLREKVIDELADVQIMIMQMTHYFDRNELDERIEFKLGRLAERVSDKLAPLMEGGRS